jgi:RNA polymerase sigma-70 factor (ECF subfamily)
MEEEPTMSVIHADRPRSLISDFEDFAAKPSGYDRGGSAFDAIPSWSRPSPFASLPGDENRPDRAAGRRGPLRDEQFAEVVGPRLARLQRLARKILRSDDLADDAVQEALLSLWREERPPPNLDGWLVRAVVNRSLHLNRTRRRRRYHEERACLGRSEQDPAGDASRPLETAEVARAIEATLDALPDRLRTVFVLRETEQMDYESIAESLGVPVGTVRSRLHRAKEALKAALVATASVG